MRLRFVGLSLLLMLLLSIFTLALFLLVFVGPLAAVLLSTYLVLLILLVYGILEVMED